MKLEIYDNDPSAIKPPVALKLVEASGGIEVVAVNAAGETLPRARIIKLSNNGHVYMLSGVADDLGFWLTPDKRVYVG